MSDSEEDTTEKQLKVVFLGEPNVGKTSIIRRFCYDEFTRHYNQTIGADFYIKRMELPGKKEIMVRISDIGGLELNGQMFSNYLFNANVVILVYDITNAGSFDSLLSWLDMTRKTIENQIHMAVFANKSDVEHKRGVRLDRTEKVMAEMGLHNFPVSAKTGENVNPFLTGIIANHFGITLTKVERERQAPVVTAEIIPTTPEQPKKARKSNTVSGSNSSVCSVQ